MPGGPCACRRVVAVTTSRSQERAATAGLAWQRVGKPQPISGRRYDACTREAPRALKHSTRGPHGVHTESPPSTRGRGAAWRARGVACARWGVRASRCQASARPAVVSMLCRCAAGGSSAPLERWRDPHPHGGVLELGQPPLDKRPPTGSRRRRFGAAWLRRLALLRLPLRVCGARKPSA